MKFFKCVHRDVFFRRIRLVIMVICFGFVLEGWIRSLDKYYSGQTAISTSVTESFIHRYPSITFCPGTKNQVNLRELIINEHYEDKGNLTLTDDLWEGIVEKNTYKRTDFLSFFSHPKTGDPGAPQHNILLNDSMWKTSIPHEKFSGKCFTYNPSYDSKPGKWFAIMFDLRYPEDLKSEEEKAKFLDKLNIILHSKDDFVFYMEDEMPGSFKIDTAQLKANMENSFSLHMSTLTSLNKEESPCETSPNYSFLKCFELFWSRKRGCQKPWFYFPEFSIPICRNISGEIEALLGKSNEWKQPFWPKIERVTKTGCAVPCWNRIYDAQFTYSRQRSTKAKEHTPVYRVSIWFKNFQFNHRKEFIVCDWTCLIGEIGGNFGFFLGGSILASYDIAYGKISKALNKFEIY